MGDLFKRYNLTKVINARGPATVLGASRVSEAVRKDIDEMLDSSVETWQLQKRASEAISRLTGAEAGCVVGCTSAGMSIACAAAVTGANIAAIKALPTIRGKKRKVVMQKGQVTGAGDCPSYQVVRMTGAEFVEIGEALDCATFHLRAALEDDDVACAMYVMEDVFAPNLLPLETFISICHEKNVPVVVDAAYLTDFEMLWKMGADIAIYSSQKWLGGATAGIIAGRKDLVYACYLQEMGIGRPMKVGKEGMIGTISAINQWLSCDREKIFEQQRAMAEKLAALLPDTEGFTCSIERSLYSPSARLDVKIDQEKTGVAAWVINDELGEMDPVIKTDDYAVNQGRIIFDFAYLDPGDEAIIADSIRTIIEKNRGKDNCKSTVLKTRQDITFEIFSKWY